MGLHYDEECDNCGKTAVNAVSGGHDNNREFRYCESCTPPEPKHIGRIIVEAENNDA